MSRQSKFRKHFMTSEEDGDPECAKTLKRSRNYNDDSRKYLKTWEKEFPWLTSVNSEDIEVLFCKLCRKSLQPHHGTLVKHAQGAHHKRSMTAASGCETINFSTKELELSDDLKRAELELALTTCSHYPALAIDHIGEVIKKNGKGSTLEHLRLHRTKYTALINSVLSPSLRDEVMTDIKGKKFSLILDETTGFQVEKLLVMCTRYFSEKSGGVVTAFLGLYAVAHTTGEEPFQILKGCLSEHGMCLSDCVGIAFDGGAAVLGEHSSVWSRIKEQSPNCILNKCVRHSLALCVKKAFETLPPCLGYLLTEIPEWFSYSSLRRNACNKLFADIEEQEVEAQSDPKTGQMPPLNLPDTRSLVRGLAIERYLENWDALKDHFKLAMQEGTQEVRYKAGLIHDILHDDTNYFYFKFLSPIVLEFEKTSKVFQSANVDPEKMYKRLDRLHRKLKERIFDKHGSILPLGMTDFGDQFNKELLRKRQVSTLDGPSVQWVKECSRDFLKDLLKEVEKRLPVNPENFRGMRGLHPSKVLSQTERLPVSELPLQHLIEENRKVIEVQYKEIVKHLWGEEAVFGGQLPVESVPFWAGIFKYENKKGEKPYKELALYALACLSCSVSNEVVERVFSHVVGMEKKYRNKMSLETLNAIVRIRTALASKQTCCMEFNITDDMLRRYHSDIYYAQIND